MKQFLIFLVLASVPYIQAHALPEAIVARLSGTATFNKKPLALGDVIKTAGILATGKKSFIKIEIAAWANSIVIGSKSKMKINLTSKDVKKKYSFLKGLCRWKTMIGTKPANKDKKGAIFTKTAILGVRGTDFSLKVNPLLGESEIIVFDGQVELKNAKNSNDKVLVNKGQWGGIGGRYGTRVAKVLDLPKKYLKKAAKKLNKK